MKDSKEPPLPNLSLLYVGLVAFSIVGSIISTYGHLEPGPIKPIASLLTLATGFSIVCLSFDAPFALVAVVLVGLFAEVCGIYLGVPFGKYEYTTAWWPVVELPLRRNFPLQLPFAWVTIVGSATLISSIKTTSRTSVVIASALIASICDLAMEPVMTGQLGYWHWNEAGPLPGHAPTMNFVGWFLVSAIASFALTQKPVEIRNVGPAITVLGGQMVLMLAIAVIQR